MMNWCFKSGVTGGARLIYKLLVLCAVFATPRLAAQWQPDPAAPQVEAWERGRQIYLNRGRCASCHGHSGQGDGPAASALSAPPANLARLKISASDPTVIRKIITDGSAPAPMPGFKSLLTAEEIELLVAWVLHLAKNPAK